MKMRPAKTRTLPPSLNKEFPNFFMVVQTEIPRHVRPNNQRIVTMANLPLAFMKMMNRFPAHITIKIMRNALSV